MCSEIGVKGFAEKLEKRSAPLHIRCTGPTLTLLDQGF